MISVAEALDRVLNLVRPVGCESVPLAEAAGRILAEHVVAERDQPPFNASSMDGYALRSEDLETRDQFEIIGESPAGRSFEGEVASGQTVRIFTGGRMPKGSDRVVIQEDVHREGKRIRLKSECNQDAYVRYAGGDFRRGDRLEAPTKLTPARLALAASMNASRIVVRKRPVIAFIPNGDELAMPGERLHADQVVASNAFGLRAILEDSGARFRSLPIARDSFASLSTAFEFAEGADLIVTSGGASVGEYDLVRQTAGKLGMQNGVLQGRYAARQTIDGRSPQRDADHRPPGKPGLIAGVRVCVSRSGDQGNARPAVRPPAPQQRNLVFPDRPEWTQRALHARQAVQPGRCECAAGV